MGDIRTLSIGVAFDVKSAALREVDSDITGLIHNSERLDSFATRAFEKISAGASKGKASTAELGGAVQKSAASFEKLEAGATKASEKLTALSEHGKQAGSGIYEGLNRADGAVTRSLTAMEKLKYVLKGVTPEGKSIGAGIASGANKGIEAVDREISAIGRLKSALGGIKGSNNLGNVNAGNVSTSEKGGKVSGAFKDSMAMFGPGMLLASGVMGIANGVSGMFSNGWETLKERQAGQAMWATSIQDAHKNVKGAQLTSQANRANDAIMSTSILAGNDFTEGNAIAKQIYSSDGGVYAGNVKKTQNMLKGMFNIQDANALTGREMEQFKTAVGNVGDTGKMSGTIAKSLNLLDGKMTRKIRDEYKKRNGHELGKNKMGGWDWGQVDAETAFAAIDGYGNSSGVGKASERYNSTLPGVLRSGKAAGGFLISQAMSSFGSKIAKGGAFKDILGNLSKGFTDMGGLKSKADGLASALAGVANIFGKIIQATTPLVGLLGKVWDKTAAFRGGFLDGIVSGLDKVKSGIDKLKEWGGKAQSAIEKMLPKGFDKDFDKVTGGLGKFFGELAIGVGVIKGLTKLPGIGGLLKGGLGFAGKATKLDKVPGLSKLFGGGKTPKGSNRDLNENTSALQRLTAALNGNGDGSYNEDGDGYSEGGKKGKKLSTRSNRKYNKAASKYERQVEKYGADSKQAKRAGSKLSKYSDKSSSYVGKLESKYERVAGRKGAHSRKATKLRGRIATASDEALAIGGRVESTRAGSVATRTTRLAASKGGRLGRAFGRAGGAFGKVGGAVGKISGFASKIPGAGLVRGAGKVAGKLGGVANLAFMGLDVASAASMKPGKTRRKAVGGAVGSGVGGVVGGALGSLLGPVGTVAGGMAGSWLGEKAGKAIGGLNFKKMAKGAGEFGKSVKKNVSGAMESAGKVAGKVGKSVGNFFTSHSKAGAKIGSNLGKGLKAFKANPQKAIKSEMKSLAKSGPIMGPLKLIGDAGKNIFKGVKMPKWMTSIGNTFSKIKMPKLSNPFKGFKMPKIKMPKFKNPFKGFKLPKIKNPFSGWKQPSWMKNISKWFGGADKGGKKTSKSADKATKSTKKTGDEAKKTSKHVEKVGKSGDSSFKKLASAAKSSSSKVTSAFSKVGKNTSKAFSGISKSSKKEFNKLSTSAKQGMSKASKAMSSGGKGIKKAVTSSFKGIGTAGKSQFNKLSSSVKSGMSKASSAAKSGAHKIPTAVKSGLAGMNSIGKGTFNKLTSSVKSGMNAAKNAAKSGSNQVVSAVKSGMSKMGSAGNSAFSKLASASTSGMNKVENAVQNGANKAANTFKSSFNKMVSTATSVSSKVSSSMATIGNSAGTATGKVKTLAAAISALKDKKVTIDVAVKGDTSKLGGKFANGTPGARAAFAKYAKGTPAGGSHPGGMALVNDEQSSTFREAFMLPNGLVGLFPNERNIMVPLPAGSHVLNAQDTRRKFAKLNAYAKGTPKAIQAFNAMSEAQPVKSNADKRNIEINIKPEINISGVAGAGLEKMVMAAVMPYLEAMSQNLSDTLGLI